MSELGVISRFRPSAIAEWADSSAQTTLTFVHRTLRLAQFTVPLIACVFLWSRAAISQEAATQAPVVAQKQVDVTERYRRLEELLLRLADLEADENPERAALLRRAAKQSRDTFVLEKMQEAGTSLKSEQFAKAIENQTNAREGVNRLLELLLSEDRPQRIRDEKKRIADVIKELKLVERLQRSTRARTENGAELSEIAQEQKQIGDRSEKVSKQLGDEEKDGEGEQPPAKPDDPSAKPEDGSAESGKESKPGEGKQGEESKEPKSTEEPSDAPEQSPGEDMQKPEEGQSSDSKPSDSKPSDSKPSDSKPSDSKPSDSKPSDSKPSDSKPSDSKPSDSKPSDSKPSDSQPSESKPSESQSGESSESESSESQPQQPQSQEQQAESQLEQAIKKMRQAEQELEESKRSDAVEQHKQAEENLRTAIDRLERILRQLREEEMQRELARLESRIRKMAQMQGKVLDDTKLLVAIPESQRDRQVDLKSGNLGFEEKKIVMEADRAMLLLREEGSSVAFPEVMVQVRADMQRVAERLTATKLDAVTTGIQEDILAALEEMIAALQQAQRDLEKQKQQAEQGQQQQSQESGEQPLVQQIAELKLIRTMETRIKTTTQRYAELLDKAPSGNSDVVQLLQELAQRQGKLYQVTRDLVVKRNQ